MNKVVGVYETREEAVQAAKTLHYAGFAPETVTIYNREDLTNNRIHVKLSHRFELGEMTFGVVAGSVIGLLSGMGYFRIPMPGLKNIYNAGIIQGIMAGFFFGLLISAVFAFATSMIVQWQNSVRNERHLNEGKFLVFYEGHRKQDIHRAHETLHTPDLKIELSAH